MGLAGCGYGFNYGDTVLPKDSNTLAIAEVVNPTTYSWLEHRLRSVVRDEVIRKGVAKWTSVEDAEYLLYLNIEKYTRQTAVSGAKDQTLQSTASIFVEGVIRSADEREIIWRSGLIGKGWRFEKGHDKADNIVTDLVARELVNKLRTVF